MSYSASDLSEEIRRIIEDGLDRDRVLPASTIVKAVIDRHPLPRDWRGVHREFTELSSAGYVRIELRKHLREYKAAGEPADGQLRLPGFDYLQRGYLVERGGEDCVVPILQMARAECELRRDGLRKMARGCDAHADEWDRFIAERFAAAE
jgi:hypothetical protein